MDNTFTQIYIPHTWLLFCITIGTTIITTLIMMCQSKDFYTNNGSIRKFSILELELAATSQSIVNVIKGIYSLPHEQSKKSLKALKGQLYVDFIFMPAIYGLIFLVCMKLSYQMHTCFGKYFFSCLAWVQILAWISDISENSYLLNKLRKIKPKDIIPKPISKDCDETLLQTFETPQPLRFKLYQFMEFVKWGFSLTGGICSISMLLFFWVTGHLLSILCR
jgi:hypothetical protein